MEGHYLEHDGSRYGYCDLKVNIEHFTGARKIVKLAAYPLEYGPNPEGTRERFLIQGKQYVALATNSVQFYDGLAQVRTEEDVSLVPIHGRIIIDPQGYRKWSTDNHTCLFPKLMVLDYS